MLSYDKFASQMAKALTSDELTHIGEVGTFSPTIFDECCKEWCCEKNGIGCDCNVKPLTPEQEVEYKAIMSGYYPESRITLDEASKAVITAEEATEIDEWLKRKAD